MPTRRPHPVQIAPSPGGFRLIRPGARYAVERRGEEHPGDWLPDDAALPKGWVDTFPEDLARAVLPLLRRLDGAAAGKGGRKGAEPTTPDGRLIARACKRLGLTAAQLAEAIGAHESVLSRARHGELPERHREAIKALLQGAAKTEEAKPPRRKPQ
ncbi:helix-turn-helix domain-containing protein [Sorangium sp. So ce388]|uniref:helix-turn-helix domain-containing protein n=1 Tax=Sorangium sp. So ce388 TaxID=3133309 RepID=UPI003F5C1BB0